MIRITVSLLFSPTYSSYILSSHRLLFDSFVYQTVNSISYGHLTNGIPNSILFENASSVLPNCCWRLFYRWNPNTKIVIKRASQTSDVIQEQRGTRQSALCSPMLFNLFSQGSIEELNSKSCDITIHGHHYNVYCYTDDVLLASTLPPVNNLSFTQQSVTLQLTDCC